MVEFAPFGAIHAAWLGVAAIVVLLPLLLARWKAHLARAAVALELCWAASGAVLLFTERGAARWQDALPLHLCDLVVVIVAIAFFWRQQTAFELAYFYGLTGSLAALLTPDISGIMPLWRVAYFFGGHAAVITAVVYLVAVEHRRPAQGAVLRAMIGLAIYTAVIGTFNAIAGTNYGYLCHKPHQPSLLDWLGPWPWYIASLGVVGLVCFILLDWIGRKLPTHHHF